MRKTLKAHKDTGLIPGDVVIVDTSEKRWIVKFWYFIRRKKLYPRKEIWTVNSIEDEE